MYVDQLYVVVLADRATVLARPLPDESPRGSIANLINRFENQTKRVSQSGGISVSSRSSSVISQTSSVGDALKEDSKDKREWPPKSLSQTSEKLGFVMPSYLRPNVGTLASTVASSLAATSSPPAGPPEAEPAPASEQASEAPKAAPPTGGTPPVAPLLATSNSNSSIKSDSQIKARTSVPPVEITPPTSAREAPEEMEPDTPKPGTLGRKASTSTVTAPHSAPASVIKPSGKPSAPARSPPAARPAPAPKTPARAAVASASKVPAAPTTTTRQQTLAPPTSYPSIQPVKPQHTGNSVASSTTGPSRRPVSRATPATPSRAKTPSISKVSSAAAAASRARSPVTRAKTPSTGLYAPTAASLARSRNAPPLPQATPVRKVLSSEVAERLSKPTAASLSKLRTTSSSSVSGMGSPRPSFGGGGGGTPAKRPAAATFGTPAKTTPIRKSVSSPAIKKATSPSAASGRVLGASKDDGAVLDSDSDVLGPETTLRSEDILVPVSSPIPVAQTRSFEEPEEAFKEIEQGPVAPEEAKTEEEEVVPLVPANGVKVGNDIEDIVNMLEFIPVSKMLSAAEGNGDTGEDRVVRPEEVHAEIPDEE